MIDFYRSTHTFNEHLGDIFFNCGTMINFLNSVISSVLREIDPQEEILSGGDGGGEESMVLNVWEKLQTVYLSQEFIRQIRKIKL